MIRLNSTEGRHLCSHEESERDQQVRKGLRCSDTYETHASLTLGLIAVRVKHGAAMRDRGKMKQVHRRWCLRPPDHRANIPNAFTQRPPHLSPFISPDMLSLSVSLPCNQTVDDIWNWLANGGCRWVSPLPSPPPHPFRCVFLGHRLRH